MGRDHSFQHGERIIATAIKTRASVLVVAVDSNEHTCTVLSPHFARLQAKHAVLD